MGWASQVGNHHQFRETEKSQGGQNISTQPVTVPEYQTSDTKGFKKKKKKKSRVY